MQRLQSASFWLVQPEGQHPSPFVQDVLGIEEQEAEQVPGLEHVYVRHGLEPQSLACEQAGVWQEPEQQFPDAQEQSPEQEEQVSPIWGLQPSLPQHWLREQSWGQVLHSPESQLPLPHGLAWQVPPTQQ